MSGNLQGFIDLEILDEVERRFGRGLRLVIDARGMLDDEISPADFKEEDAAYLALGWSIDRLTDASSSWAYRTKIDRREERYGIAAAILSRLLDDGDEP